MKREVTSKINWVLDNLIPPVLRDSKLIMGFLFWPLFKSKTKYFLEFKERVITMNHDDLEEYYKLLYDTHIKRDTDLTQKAIKHIIENVKGVTVLDIACGKGYLANKIQSKTNKVVTGADFNICETFNDNNKIIYVEENIEKLTFSDKSFDTVICAHTLEHTFDIQKVVSELRRVCALRLIIMVPRQREYKYTFDLHTHYFPHKWKLELLMNNVNAISYYVGQDIMYIEDIENIKNIR